MTDDGQLWSYNLVRGQPGPQAVLRVKVVKAATCSQQQMDQAQQQQMYGPPTAGQVEGGKRVTGVHYYYHHVECWVRTSSYIAEC
jgi:hypothetical protein